MKAQLILENGQRFEGTMFGALKDVVGEIVFTTGMSGYQETLTDPALCGQIVTMSFPLVGDYGINLDDNEAPRTYLKALVVREKCDFPSNFRNEMNLDDFLREEGVVGIEGIDTRALTRLIRDNGCMKAVIMKGEATDDEAKKLMDTLDNSNVIMETTTKEIYTINEKGSTHVAFIDLGTKGGILRSLEERNCKITVLPAYVKAEEIEKLNPDMVFLSSGPGDPADAPGTVDEVKKLVGKYPIFGICLGHLILGMALGCKIEKMKFGHHGGNHPAKDTLTGRCYVTSQSHNHIVCDLPDDVEEMFVNVNDGTNEGIKHKTLPIMSVQFHPEASPGPKEPGWVFDRFLETVSK